VGRRFELLEIIVRMAIGKFIVPKVRDHDALRCAIMFANFTIMQSPHEGSVIRASRLARRS